jgi:hypothetical protein
VVFRDLAVHDGVRLPWRELQWALRRLEDRGLVRGGRFVAGFSGEQYALPEAAEQLDHVRKLPRTGERVVVNATDPCNLVGVIVPGATVPAVRTNHVTYVDGVVSTTPDATAPTPSRPSPETTGPHPRPTPARSGAASPDPARPDGGRPAVARPGASRPAPARSVVARSDAGRSGIAERLTREILERAANPRP